MDEEQREQQPAKKHHTINVWVRSFWYKVLDHTHLKDDTDYESTVTNIASSVEFRGVNVWVLAFAIIVASVGLNMNSTAVIIGAMLISPIMGPILGIGLSIGTIDEELLRRSLRNFLIMVAISLVTSTLYFLISPINEAQSELFARTRPTTYDVIIAFFGGLAGIVATSRKNPPFTVISGVAIATALMPPLCTAGYGLANLNMRFFGGAIYLFFINSFFIALATFIMVRFLGFPQRRYVNGSRLAAVKRWMYIFAIIVMIPSVIMAVNLVRETAFNTQVNKFVADIKQSKTFENVQLIEYTSDYARDNQEVTLRVVGKPLTVEDIAKMQSLMQTVYGLGHAKLIVRQPEGLIDITQQNQVIEDIIDKKDAVIAKQDSIIDQLRTQVEVSSGTSEIISQIVKEIHTQYPDIESVAIADMQNYNAASLEHSRMPVVYLKWKDNRHHPEAEKRLVEWLKVRLNVDNINIVRMS